VHNCGGSVRGSTLHVEVPPTIAVDPGSRYTAGLLRVGAEAVDGFTVAPVDEHGDVALDALDDLDDGAALQRYLDLILREIDGMWDRYDPDAPIRVAVEQYMLLNKHNRRSLLAAFVPRQVIAAVLGRYEGAVLVPHGCNGGRHQLARGGTGNPADYYPPQLFGGGWPSRWGPNMHPRRMKDHVQSCYDLAPLAWADALSDSHAAA
jgi:hypothetical protein